MGRVSLPTTSERLKSLRTKSSGTIAHKDRKSSVEDSSSHIRHDSGPGESVHSLISFRISVINAHFMAVFLDTAVERLILQPIVSRR
jgi:hypothetical protein